MILVIVRHGENENFQAAFESCRVVLSWVGRQFQVRGAATESVLSPNFRRAFGTTKVSVRRVGKCRPRREVGNRNQQVVQPVSRCVADRQFVHQEDTVCIRYVEQSATSGDP